MTSVRHIAMLGSFPPLRALSSYCLGLASSLAERTLITFISFKKIYPAFLYPGGGLSDDHSFPEAESPNLAVRRKLTWYNPLSWIVEGMAVNADVLHAQWWSFPLLPMYVTVCGICRLRGIPIVLTVHNVLPHEHSRAYIAGSRLLFRLSDHFIVHTSQNRRQLIDVYGIPSDAISLVPHGLLDFHVKLGTDRESLRRDLGFRPEDQVILLFGAVRAYKGVDTLLRAFAEITGVFPRARLLIAGKLWVDWTPYQNIIDALGMQDRVVTHLDYIPSGDVYRFFESADLAVLPYTHFDSQSGVGATALAFHKPLIVSEAGGLQELIADNRFAVPEGDPKALAHAIATGLSSPELLLKMASDSAKIAARFTWPAIADATMGIYEKVMRPSDG